MNEAIAGTQQASATVSLEERLAEAATYALLRRLTPALRHHMVGALQPLGMVAAMLERRSQVAAPDMASIIQPPRRSSFQNSAVLGSKTTPFTATPKR